MLRTVLVFALAACASAFAPPTLAQPLRPVARSAASSVQVSRGVMFLLRGCEAAAWRSLRCT